MALILLCPAALHKLLCMVEGVSESTALSERTSDQFTGPGRGLPFQRPAPAAGRSGMGEASRSSGAKEGTLVQYNEKGRWVVLRLKAPGVRSARQDSALDLWSSALGVPW